MRLTPANAEALLPCVAHALLARKRVELRWWSHRIALVICSQATSKDGQPLHPQDIFPELAE